MTHIINESKQNIYTLLHNSQLWLIMTKKLLSIIVIMFIAMISIRLIKFIIQRIFNLRYKATILDRHERTMKKNKTIEKLLISIAKYTIYFLTLVSIFSNLGINLTGLIAGAGLVSVAIGFGAQTLVKDIITGFFIALEDQFSVGDYIQIYNGSNIIAEGTVDVLGLRATKLKSSTGEEWFVPNSQIIQVLNKSMNFSMVTIDMTISSHQDIQQIRQLLKGYLLKLQSTKDYQAVLYSKSKQSLNPKLLGIESIGQNNITLRIIGESEPMKNNLLQRMLNEDLMLFTQKHQIKLVNLSNNFKK